MLNIGELISSRYEVVAELGKGGMAEVYKVWDRDMTTHLALKLLREDLAEDKVFLRRFKREAKTLSELQHPNIVRFYGFQIAEGNAFMLLDFIDGITLRKKIYELDGPMSLEEVIRLMSPVCSALQFAHNRGLVHNDVKPANIMIHRNGTVLLTDFGIARMIEGSTMTLAGAGTPAYMAPEQCRGLDSSPRTDIYALGIILFELFTGGERPFTGDRAKTTGTVGEKVRWEQLNSRPHTIRKYNPDIPPAIERIIKKCLAKDSEERYQTTIDLIHDLVKENTNVPVIAAVEEPLAEPEFMNPNPSYDRIADAVYIENDESNQRSEVPIIAPGPVEPGIEPEQTSVVEEPIRSTWSCQNCGMNNPSTRTTCEDCGVEKGKIYRSNWKGLYLILFVFLAFLGFIGFTYMSNPDRDPTLSPAATKNNTSTSKPRATATQSASAKATSTAATQFALMDANERKNNQKCDVVSKLPFQTNWPVKYCNMFDNDLDWFTEEIDDEWSKHSSSILGGYLIFDLYSKQGFLFNNEIYPSRSNQFILSMNTFNEGIGDVESGIILYTSQDSYVLFSIIQEYQNFSIYQYNSGTEEWLPFLDYTKSSAIKPTGYNRLTIAQIDGTIDFYINDRQVHRWNNSPFDDATLGFGVGMFQPDTQVEFYIDDLVVLTP